MNFKFLSQKESRRKNLRQWNMQLPGSRDSGNIQLIYYTIGLCRSRRGLGDRKPGDDRKIRYRCVLRRLLRLRRWTIADRTKVSGDGHSFFHRRHRPPHLSLHRSFGRILESLTPNRDGFVECCRRPYFCIPAGDAQHSPAADDRGGWAVRGWFQIVVLPDVTKVSNSDDENMKRKKKQNFYFKEKNFFGMILA